MPKRPRLPDSSSVVARIVGMRRAGSTYAEITASTGASTSWISHTLRRWAPELRPGRGTTRRPLTPESEARRARIIEMRRRGLTHAAIGKVFGLSHQGVRKIVAAAAPELLVRQPAGARDQAEPGVGPESAAGIAAADRGAQRQRRRWIIAMRRRGMPPARIARALGITAQAVNDITRRYAPRLLEPRDR